FTSLSEGYLVSISKASHLCGPMICPGGTRIQISSVQSPQRFPQSVCRKAYHALKSPRARGASRSVNPISAELALRGGSGPLVIFPSWRHRLVRSFATVAPAHFCGTQYASKFDVYRGGVTNSSNSLRRIFPLL